MVSFPKNDFIAISRFVFDAYLIGITGKSFSLHSMFGPMKMKDGAVKSLELQDGIMNFDPDPDLQRPRYRFRDRFLVPEYRSVRITVAGRERLLFIGLKIQNLLLY
jgi:hypothetical protein